jgi:hypothetical protein
MYYGAWLMKKKIRMDASQELPDMIKPGFIESPSPDSTVNLTEARD